MVAEVDAGVEGNEEGVGISTTSVSKEPEIPERCEFYSFPITPVLLCISAR